MQVEAVLGENPQSYIEGSALTMSGGIRNDQKFTNKNNLFQQCKTILSKSYESRPPVDNSIVLRLIDKSQFLKQLSQSISFDFTKGLLRNAKIEIIQEKQVITEEDQDLNYMVIVLDGKLGIEKPSLGGFDVKAKGKETIDFQEMKTPEIFQKLTIIAKRQRDLQKSKSKLQRKSSIPISSYDLSLPILSEGDYQSFTSNVQRVINPNEEYGAKQRVFSKMYRNRAAGLQRTTLLVLEIKFVFYWLEHAFKVKLNKNIKLMKNVPCFSTIEEDQKLAEVILSMKECKRAKNDIIYHQGDESDLLYILIQGSVKLVKKANLFRQNPNDLYTDRRKIVEQMHKNDKKYRTSSNKNHGQDILPFANFTTLYNYRPIKKVIQIGVMSSFGLFGQEELIFKKQRQTSTIVDSLEAAYYQIQFKKILQIIGVKNVEKFKEALENSAFKKVLYRQSEYADHIGLQNKNNLDYFYLDDNKQKESPRKFKLEKLNERMMSLKKKDPNTHAPAYYTSFNFNKMLSSNRYSDSEQKTKTKNRGNESTDSLVSVFLNQSEERMVKISHSWRPIEKKVKQEKQLSFKISPLKHDINIQSPLIDQQYFRDVAKEKQRITKEHRTFKLSLGKKLK